MQTLLVEPSEQREITLEDGIYHAKIKCTTTKYLLPKFTRIDLELIENTFLTINKDSFEREWYDKMLPLQENLEFYLIRQLRVSFKTEAKPTF